MNYPFFSLSVAVLSCLLTLPAQAEKADRDKPMSIEADALRYDDLRQASVATGKVVATKGTMVIRAARLEVRQDAEGYQHATITAEPGKRAFYRQKREGVDEYIEGEAEVIEYNGKADSVRFVRRAELRRFKGSTLNDEMTGNLIVYDNASDVFSVDGSTATGNPGSVGGRVRAMLTPARSAASAAVGVQPVLKATPVLGGEKK